MMRRFLRATVTSGARATVAVRLVNRYRRARSVDVDAGCARGNGGGEGTMKAREGETRREGVGDDEGPRGLDAVSTRTRTND